MSDEDNDDVFENFLLYAFLVFFPTFYKTSVKSA